jgi:hypothetical protein
VQISREWKLLDGSFRWHRRRPAGAYDEEKAFGPTQARGRTATGDFHPMRAHRLVPDRLRAKK